jgi:phage anti-repressor protein
MIPNSTHHPSLTFNQPRGSVSVFRNECGFEPANENHKAHNAPSQDAHRARFLMLERAFYGLARRGAEKLAASLVSGSSNPPLSDHHFELDGLALPSQGSANMTNESIPIIVKHVKLNGEDIPTVNARELYAFLGIKRDFSNWIKSRIEDYGFVESQDYTIGRDLRSPNLANAKSRAVIAIDYHLTLDMAKELCMIERNDKGRQARRYFIACEKKVLAQYRVDAAQLPLQLPRQSKTPKAITHTKAAPVNAETTQELLRLVRLAEIIPQLDPMIALLTRLKNTLPSHVGNDIYPDHLTSLIRDQHTGSMK